MLLKYFYDKALAQASYMVGCQQTGQAIVIDPARDITPYLQAGHEEGLRITHVTETHIHADFVSGTRELAAHTDAAILLSAMGGSEWRYQFDHLKLHHGDTFMVGTAHFNVMHTPGHTPEHIVFKLTDTSIADRPMGMFTGDCLFVGDVGRPDLLEEAVGIAGSSVPAARQQFQNIQAFKTLPDFWQIWTGHGAGSACGKALGAVPTTTLGYEKLFNPAFQINDEDEFVRWLLDGQPETPRYFAQMKRVNRDGAALLDELNQPLRLDPTLLSDVIRTALVIDTRHGDQFARAHLPNTLHIPATSDRFSTYVGWFVDYTQPIYLIADENDAPQIITQLRAIGIDNIPGYFTTDEAEKGSGKMKQALPIHIKPDEAYWILDVRNQSEYEEFHIPAAHHIPMGHIPQRLAEIPRDAQIVVYCGSGVRSLIVASLLQARGFNVVDMQGGIDAWKAAKLPVQKSHPR